MLGEMFRDHEILRTGKAPDLRAEKGRPTSPEPVVIARFRLQIRNIKPYHANLTAKLQ